MGDHLIKTTAAIAICTENYKDTEGTKPELPNPIPSLNGHCFFVKRLLRMNIASLNLEEIEERESLFGQDHVF